MNVPLYFSAEKAEDILFLQRLYWSCSAFLSTRNLAGKYNIWDYNQTKPKKSTLFIVSYKKTTKILHTWVQKYCLKVCIWSVSTIALTSLVESDMCTLAIQWSTSELLKLTMSDKAICHARKSWRCTMDFTSVIVPNELPDYVVILPHRAVLFSWFFRLSSWCIYIVEKWFDLELCRVNL